MRRRPLHGTDCTLSAHASGCPPCSPLPGCTEVLLAGHQGPDASRVPKQLRKKVGVAGAHSHLSGCRWRGQAGVTCWKWDLHNSSTGGVQTCPCLTCLVEADVDRVCGRLRQVEGVGWKIGSSINQHLQRSGRQAASWVGASAWGLCAHTLTVHPQSVPSRRKPPRVPGGRRPARPSGSTPAHYTHLPAVPPRALRLDGFHPTQRVHHLWAAQPGRMKSGGHAGTCMPPRGGGEQGGLRQPITHTL